MEQTLTLVFCRTHAWIRYCFPGWDEPGTRGNPYFGLPCLDVCNSRPILSSFSARYPPILVL